MSEAEPMDRFYFPPASPDQPAPDAEHRTPNTGHRTPDALFDRIAEEVVRRGLATPAVFFLELHRPLGFIAGQATLLFSPFLGALFGLQNVRELARLLGDPATVDRLLERIEQHEKEVQASVSRTPEHPNT
jgi:hypothetical protein